MEIGYIYYGDWTEEQKAVLKKFGIELEPGGRGIDIVKDDNFNLLRPILEEWGYTKPDFVETLYTKKEIDNAHLLQYIGNWTNGCPQPEDGWKELVYDTTNMCSECHMGAVQKVPFRLKRKPIWKKKNAFDLEWQYDEIFVRKDIYEIVFKPLGIEYWDVLLYKKETLIEDTVQLKLPISDVSLDLKDQRHTVCEKCGSIRYYNQIEGYFPNFITPQPHLSICKTQEFYGHGWSCNRWIIFSQELRQVMKKNGINPSCRPVG